MVRILVIAEDGMIKPDVCACLENNGFTAEISSPSCFINKEQGYDSYALMICALSAARNSRIERYIKKWNGPMLYLVEPADLPMTVETFRMGTEDYLVMPIHVSELLARIRMLLKCAGISMERKLVIGGFQMDVNARAAFINGEQVPLTRREFDILYGLLSNPDVTFTRKELMKQYWEKESKTGMRAVDVYMTKLREKFSACMDFQIATVHGVGYKAVLR